MVNRSALTTSAGCSEFCVVEICLGIEAMGAKTFPLSDDQRKPLGAGAGLIASVR
jgi:hypothetical protein